MLHLLSVDFFRDGLPEAVFPLEALILVALLLGRRPVALVVPIRTLDGTDELGLLLRTNGNKSRIQNPVLFRIP
jgi:hypothetical protein